MITKFRCAVVLVLVLVATAGQVEAAVVFSTGAGSAVTTADRTATFDSITSFGINLSSYSEDGLSITTPNVSHIGFSPFGDGTTTGFHYGNGGGTNWVTITATDTSIFSGIEFKLGDGWAYSVTDLLWETRLGNIVNGSGLESDLARGTIVGFSGMPFDELRVAANGWPGFTASSSLGDYQAIALDNVNVQLQSNSVIPEPASLAVWSILSLAGIGGCHWRKRKQ